VDESKIVGFLGGGFGEPPVRVGDLEEAAARRRRVVHMQDHETCQVQVTVGDHEAALTLARSAVETRLAACAQISGPIRSIYRWQGELEEADEWAVVFKTRLSLYPQIEEFINEHHSYEVPEIVCTPIAKGNPAYLSWIIESTSAD
jgi:periplasmic divalent cation tolerance protein